MFIKMKAIELSVDPVTNIPFVLLANKSGKFTIPIWIGLFEASAIATVLEDIKLERPMTHDFIKTMLNKLEVNVESVEIADILDNTYYAFINLKKGRKKIRLDLRPSDAIAIALREKAEILVNKKLLTFDKPVDPKKAGRSQDAAKWRDLLKELSENEFGKYKM
ncbi:MAG: bifunctional nuclease family protein [Pseudomonadota bacterium]